MNLREGHALLEDVGLHRGEVLDLATEEWTDFQPNAVSAFNSFCEGFLQGLAFGMLPDGPEEEDDPTPLIPVTGALA